MTSPRTPSAVKPAAGAPPKGHHWVDLPVEEEELRTRLPEYADGDEVTVLTRAGYVERGTVDTHRGWCVRGEDDEPISLAAIAVRTHAGSARPRAADRYIDPRISLTIPRELLGALTEHAKREDIDRSALIRECCRAWLLLADREGVPLSEEELYWIHTE